MSLGGHWRYYLCRDEEGAVCRCLLLAKIKWKIKKMKRKSEELRDIKNNVLFNILQYSNYIYILYRIVLSNLANTDNCSLVFYLVISIFNKLIREISVFIFTKTYSCFFQLIYTVYLIFYNVLKSYIYFLACIFFFNACSTRIHCVTKADCQSALDVLGIYALCRKSLAG